MYIYLKLFASSLVPLGLSGIFYLLRRKTRFGELSFPIQQTVIGFFFGLAAICGTEFGVDVGGATASARDAAPLCAGLLFGGPAGILAGLIGGMERWFAVAWGAGAYSRLACSVSTILAGFYAAVLRRFMFDFKRPSFGFGFAIAIVMEVVHLSILFLTHLNDAARAYEIVKICTLPMVVCNAVAVALSILLLDALSRSLRKGETRLRTISQKMQSRMLLLIVLAYLFTTLFVYILQTNTALNSAEELMRIHLEDVHSELTEQPEERLPSVVRELTRNRHVGENGSILIADGNGRIVSGPAESLDRTLDECGISLGEDTAPDTRYSSYSSGEETYWMYLRSGEYSLVAVLPAAEAMKTRDAETYVNSYMEVLVFAALFALTYFLLKRLVVSNIRTLNGDLEKIIGGDLSVSVDVRDTAEFAALSDEINSTVGTLKHYIDEAASRLDKELEFAKCIQLSAMPSVFPAFPNAKEFDIYAQMDTAKEVGGDFYDFYMLTDNKLCFLIADVSGKGIPAALFMMQAKTMLKNLAEQGLPVNEIFTQANAKLCEANEAGMFVTAWMGVLDTLTGHVCFANAGHNPPVLYCPSIGYTYLKARAGMVLAGMDGIQYRMQEFDMAPGDRILLYTDGVTEAINCDKELYGEERLLDFLTENPAMTAGEALRAIKRDIDEFAGEAEQFDDITMLMVDFYGNKAVSVANTRVFPAHMDALADALAFIEGELSAADCGEDAVRSILSAGEEIFKNVALYAYGEGEGEVELGVSIRDGLCRLSFTDSGIPFDPVKTAEAEKRGERSGLGLYMVEKAMDRMHYQYFSDRNILTLLKKL